MNDTKTVLFVGGPRDGKRVVVPMYMEIFYEDDLCVHDPSLFQPSRLPTENTSIDMRRHMYREERLGYNGPAHSQGYEVSVFLHEDIPEHDLIERLIAGYKKP